MSSVAKSTVAPLRRASEEASMTMGVVDEGKESDEEVGGGDAREKVLWEGRGRRMTSEGQQMKGSPPDSPRHGRP